MSFASFRCRAHSACAPGVVIVGSAVLFADDEPNVGREMLKLVRRAAVLPSSRL